MALIHCWKMPLTSSDALPPLVVFMVILYMAIQKNKQSNKLYKL